MPVITGARRAKLRARVAAQLFNATATIYQRTLSSDGEGGQQEAWTTARASNVACLVSRDGQATDRLEGGKPVNPQLWRIRFKSDQTIAETDRMLIGSDTYAVVGAVGVGSLAVVNRVICRKL
jgi:hypothetical protein